MCPPMHRREMIAWIALLFHVVLVVSFLLNGNGLAFVGRGDRRRFVRGEERAWHGGHPLDTRPGSCWCSSESGGTAGGKHEYCMCTPSLAVDVVIASGPDHVWLVRRKDTGQLATMGGFVEVGESAEDAVRRELLEETGLELEGSPPRLIGFYSDPRRDNRRDTASVVYVVEVPPDAKPRAADDVKDVQRIALNDIERHDYFADHKTILMDYRRSLRAPRSAPDGKAANPEQDGEFARDIIRSTCF